MDISTTRGILQLLSTADFALEGNTEMSTYEILEGLPPYGPIAEDCGGGHSEGFVIRFRPASGDDWVGNFGGGMGGLDTVMTHPDGIHYIVLAAGKPFVVNPETKEYEEGPGWGIKLVLNLQEPQRVILGNDICFYAVGMEGLLWETRRISWDGMRDIELKDGRITGQAWSFAAPEWSDFSVNIITGEVTGGSYTEPIQ